MAKREKENQDPDLVNFKPSKRSRFVSPLSKSEMDVVTKGFIPENSKKSIAWALQVFHEWVIAVGIVHPLLKRNVPRSCWKLANQIL